MRQVRVVEMNESELPMKCRNEPLDDAESSLSKLRVSISIEKLPGEVRTFFLD